MISVRWVVLLVAIAHGGVACGQWDRDDQISAVYNAALMRMGHGIQLHKDIAGLSIAIADETVGDTQLTASAIGRLGRTVAARAAMRDYLRRRNGRRPLRGMVEGRELLVTPASLTNRDWERLYSSGGFVTFSPVGFDPPGEVAFVYVTHSCGFSECATGHYLFLSRESGMWVVTRSVLAWIS